MMSRLPLPAARASNHSQKKKKHTVNFFQNNTLYRDVNDNVRAKDSPEKKRTSSVTMVQVKNITNKKKEDAFYTHVN